MQKVNLTCIVVEDDLTSQAIIKRFIDKTDFLVLSAVFSDAISANNYLSKNTIDIVILDIEMPEMSGFELLETLTFSPEIIITSSNKDYALDAYSFDVTDFLLKPIESYSRFIKSINRAKNNIESSKSIIQGPESIFIKVDSRLVRLYLNEINFIEAYGDYVRIITDDNAHVVYSTLKVFMKNLPGKEFLQIHRSFIVRIDKVKSIEGNSIKIGSKLLPISRSFREVAMDRIKSS